MPVQNLVADELTIHTEVIGGTLRLTMLGKSVSREPGRVLMPYFTQALEHATSLHANVEVHFESLEHFNSSTIASVIQFINAAQEQRVALALHYDPSLKWQALSFEALKRAIRPFENTNADRVQFVEAHRA